MSKEKKEGTPCHLRNKFSNLQNYDEGNAFFMEEPSKSEKD
jgi:hypothetical protein